MRRLLLIFAVVLFPAAPLAQTKIKVGTVRSTVIGGVVSAQARGYFKDAGLDVDIALIDASAAFVPALATNELNVVEGGISANLFNGVAQGLPIKIAFDSTSTPINHSLMLRYDLRNEIKSIRDLKGRTVAVNAPNSIALYEVHPYPRERRPHDQRRANQGHTVRADGSRVPNQGHRRWPRDNAVHGVVA
jgi:ABC-type nitrate/sulfonate/bicarbonate transport system substrate-binding protein